MNQELWVFAFGLVGAFGGWVYAQFRDVWRAYSELSERVTRIETKGECSCTNES